jgi:hypothetical protein
MQAVDTVIALQDMPISHSNRRRAQSRSEIESKEPSQALSNATVAVSRLFSDGTQRAFTLSRDQLLTIEWE